MSLPNAITREDYYLNKIANPSDDHELPDAITRQQHYLKAIAENAGGGGGDEKPYIYSETEREVGSWINGKPLYQITVIASATTDLQDETFNIANIEEIVNIEARGAASAENDTYVPGTFIVNNDYRLSFDVQEITASTVKIRLYKASGYVMKYYTLFYTKTTDTAII